MNSMVAKKVAISQIVIGCLILFAVLYVRPIEAQEDVDEPVATPIAITITPVASEDETLSIFNVDVVCPNSNCAGIDIVIQTDPSVVQLEWLELGSFPNLAGLPYFVLRHDVDSQSGIAQLMYVTQGATGASSGTEGQLFQFGARSVQPGTGQINVAKIKVSDFNGVEVPIGLLDIMVFDTSPIVEVLPDNYALELHVITETNHSNQVNVISEQATIVDIESLPDSNIAVVHLLAAAEDSIAAELVLSAPGHLDCRLSMQTLLQQPESTMTIVLEAGDANADGTIDGVDAEFIAAGMGDVNGDQSVNLFDLIHTGRNFGKAAGICQ